MSITKSLYESVANRIRLWEHKSKLRSQLASLETKRLDLANRVLADQMRVQESWGRMGTDYELGWNQAINTQLRSGGDEKTALSLNTIVDTMIPQSRRMFVHNPFAQSAYRNLLHYVVGKGYSYRKVGANQEKVTEWWDEWVRRNDWREIEAEILKRLIRDGEVFIRWFDDQPRFVEPKQVVGTTVAPWGIEVDPKDQIVRKFYYISPTTPDGLIDSSKAEKVKAEEIEHLTWPIVDKNTLRGMPPLYFVAANLEGAARCLKNMRELVAVQTAIAIVREHIEGVTGTDIATWATAAADKTVDDPDTGGTVFQKKWGSGLVVEVPHGEKLHFPAASMRADSYIEVVQADLRAVAASLGLPEFIFTADAGRSNYASLMAAEGPAVKAFEYVQAWLGRYLARCFNRVIAAAVNGKATSMKANKALGLEDWGSLPKRVITLPTSVVGPGVRTRDFFAEARTRLIDAQAGTLSPQQWCGSASRDYDETMAQIEEHRKKFPDIPWPPTTPAQSAQYAEENSPGAAPAEGESEQKGKTGSEKRDAGKSGA